MINSFRFQLRLSVFIVSNIYVNVAYRDVAVRFIFVAHVYGNRLSISVCQAQFNILPDLYNNVRYVVSAGIRRIDLDSRPLEWPFVSGQLATYDSGEGRDG